MNERQLPNWIEASAMLREAMEQYQERKERPSLARVIDDVNDYIDTHRRNQEPLSEKTIQRDIGNKAGSSKLHAIPNWRVKIYAQWFYHDVGKNRAWIARWFAQTAYPSPQSVFVEICGAVTTNVPSLRGILWGQFLNRIEEIRKIQQWADTQHHPIAVLWGFGGTGKSTLQRKVGEEFVYGEKCTLCAPFDGAVWISALDYPEGQPTLLDVLRKIAQTFALFPKETYLEQIRPEIIEGSVKRCLQEQRILVLLDNFETIAPKNQMDILNVLSNLSGCSQTLISSRERPDWLLHHPMAHLLIPISGLSDQDAETFVHEFITAKALPQHSFTPQAIQRLIAVTQNNPKSILAVLGIVEQGTSLPALLDAIEAGKPEADRIFEEIINKAWQELLTEHEKSVFMAKALFSHSVADDDLGAVAGIHGDDLQHAVTKLVAISVFEFEYVQDVPRRIKTHPLAQSFARRILSKYPAIESEMEARWWQEYAPNIVRKARTTAYQSLTSTVEDDVANVVERIERHVHQRTSYALPAAKMFVGHDGLGEPLIAWGKWDLALRLADVTLQFGIEHQHPEVIGRSAFRFICAISQSRGNLGVVQEYSSLVVEQNVTLRSQWLEAYIKYNQGCDYRHRGYFQAAEHIFHEAIQIFLELGDTRGIVETYQQLGKALVDSATEYLADAIDQQGTTQTVLAAAVTYFNKAEDVRKQLYPNLVQSSKSVYIDFYRGMIARIQCRLDDARVLLQRCLQTHRSIYALAYVYRELALVEHLAGNTELAHAYDQKGVDYLHQLDVEVQGIGLPHCFRVIERLKQEGTW